MSVIDDFIAFKNRIVQKIKTNGSTDNTRTKGIDHRQIELDIADTLEASIKRPNPFTPTIRTSDTPILPTEKRIRYNPTGSGDITPTLPTPDNGREIWIKNAGTANLVIIENILNDYGDLEDVELGINERPLALVGDGTNWTYQ